MSEEKPKIEKLDFSEFHPLDHSILDPICSEYPGGVLRHIELWIEFKVLPFLWVNILCKVGIHSYTQFWGPEDDEWIGCEFCWKEKEGSRKGKK